MGGDFVLSQKPGTNLNAGFGTAIPPSNLDIFLIHMQIQDVFFITPCFEILSQFIEKECGPDGIVNWDGDEAHRKFRKDIQTIYDWWHNSQKDYKEVEEILWAEHKKHEPTSWFSPIKNEDGTPKMGTYTQLYTMDLQFEKEESRDIHDTLMKATNKLENMYEEDINRRLHQLVDLRMGMWT